MVYVVIGYDEDWYTFETFMGVFSTKEKAQEMIDNDCDIYDNEKIMNHQEYRIYSFIIDEGFKATEEIFSCEDSLIIERRNKMITRLEKKTAINEFKKILNEYAEKGIYFICEIDDVYEKYESHILHDYQIIDVYRDED